MGGPADWRLSPLCGWRNRASKSLGSFVRGSTTARGGPATSASVDRPRWSADDGTLTTTIIYTFLIMFTCGWVTSLGRWAIDGKGIQAGTRTVGRRPDGRGCSGRAGGQVDGMDGGDGVAIFFSLVRS